ncbi:MAG: rod-binding protein [Roseinatronobacter sp.]
MLSLTPLPEAARPQIADPPAQAPSSRHLQVARDFEAGFLAEMLSAAGAGRTPDTFGGGIGEDQFASFLVRAQAEQIAARGGIGLAEAVLRSILSQDTARNADQP